jgi:pilus assembly protein Flp/PilA
MYDTLSYVRARLLARPRTERGTSAIEYGLLVALVSVLIIGGVSLLGSHLEGMFDHSAATMP